jgi:hypothetical protein
VHHSCIICRLLNKTIHGKAFQVLLSPMPESNSKGRGYG